MNEPRADWPGIPRKQVFVFGPARKSVVLVAGLVGVAMGLSALSGVADAAPAGASTQHQAVVALRGPLPVVPGVQLQRALPSLGAAVVRGDDAALRSLAAMPGVLAVRSDDPLVLTDDTIEPVVPPATSEPAVAPPAAVAPPVDAVPAPAELVPAPGGASEPDLPAVLPPVRVEPDAMPLGGSLASRGLGSPAGTRSAGTGVRVAILDTGVSDTPALDRASGRLVDGVDTTPVRDGGAPLTDGPFTDGYGHGTFLASVLAGGPVDGSGGKALGVAPGATVVVVKVAQDDGSTSLSQVLAGLDWVIDHRDEIDVVNVSLAAELPSGDYGPDPLVVAIERVRQAGIVPVVAAGNKAGQVGDPGFAPGAITVGAADLATRTVAEHSGSAVVAGFQKPDVVANGQHVLGVLPPESVLAQEHPGARLDGKLWRGSGTSQATAVVSGVAALVLQQWPGSTPDQVNAFLHANAVDLPGDADGAGLVQRPRTVRSPAASPPVEPVGPPDPAGDGGGDPWAASSWSAGSWSAGSWSAGSWSAGSWSAGSWSAGSWSAGSWSAGSWSSDWSGEDS